MMPKKAATTAVGQALAKAGYDTAPSELALAAIEALRAANGAPAVAIDSFADRVMGDDSLKCQLAKHLSRAELMQGMFRFLHARAAEMGRACQRSPVGHTASDRPAADGSSRGTADRRATNDRPVRTQPARQQTISAKNALAVATNGIFARRIGYDLTIGTASYHDVETAEIKGHVMQRFFGRLKHELGWSSNPEIRSRQMIADVAGEKQVQAIYDDTYRFLDQVKVTNNAAA